MTAFGEIWDPGSEIDRQIEAIYQDMGNDPDGREAIEEMAAQPLPESAVVICSRISIPEVVEADPIEVVSRHDKIIAGIAFIFAATVLAVSLLPGSQVKPKNPYVPHKAQIQKVDKQPSSSPD